MRLRMEIEAQDIGSIRAFAERYGNKVFVRNRVEKNPAPAKPAVAKADVWRSFVACLLTAQQRSGPHSAVTRFLNAEPLPLEYDTCCRAPDRQASALDALTQAGGKCRTSIIAREIAVDLIALVGGLWPNLMPKLDCLRANDDARVEREVARWVAEHCRRFGPKQSRNLPQRLGLTRYEIPIDSRITMKLAELGFSITLSVAALSDPGYHEFILDGIQALCQASGVLPCVLDAAIFASFDGNGWEDVQIIG